jgi:hypothetical protein
VPSAALGLALDTSGRLSPRFVEDVVDGTNRGAIVITAHAVSAQSGLKLTATGNLAPTVVPK